MAPKKDSTSKKAATTSKGDGSKKGKGKAKGKAPVQSDSDYEYFDEDCPIFEDPPRVTIQAPIPKKRKGVEVPSLWVDEEAQKRWEEGLPVKKLHLERAFMVEKGPFKKIMQFHNFDKKLTSAPNFCNISIAREFYANGKTPNDDGAVYVRGVWVRLTSELINEHLGTPSYPNDPFACPEDESGDQGLLDELAHPGADWVVNQRGQHKHVRHQFLKADVKLWLAFVLSRLMPSSQVSEVLRKRLYLISAIRGRRSIDVGRIILNDIIEGIADDTGAIYFPLLLEELCKAQGVTDELGGDWRPTKLPIAPSLYEKYLKSDRAWMKARAAGLSRLRDEVELPDHDDLSGQSLHPYDFGAFQASLKEYQQSLDQRFISMDERMEKVEHHFTNMDERLERMHEGLDSFHQEWNSMSSNMMARLDDMANVNQQQFEVLFHRQIVMQVELDRGNKMAVYYHSDGGPPKPPPTTTQLTGCYPPNLTRDVGSGAIYEVPPGVQTTPSCLPLPSFGQIPMMPRTPSFGPRPGFDPATRIPLITAGHQVHGFHYVPQHLGGPSFAPSSSFSPPTFSIPTSSQGSPTVISPGVPPTAFQGAPPS